MPVLFPIQHHSDLIVAKISVSVGWALPTIGMKSAEYAQLNVKPKHQGSYINLVSLPHTLGTPLPASPRERLRCTHK